MEECVQEDKASSSLFSRYRSPSFRKAEVKVLIQLVEKYKHTLLNKSTNANANYAKEIAWDQLTKEFNKQASEIERTADVLRTKWDNLKRSARKVTKDVMDISCDFGDDDIYKTVAMICNDNSITDFDEQKVGNGFVDEKAEIRSWTCSDDDNLSMLFQNEDDLIRTPKKNESPIHGFSPKDCQLLLKCVRQEKNILFSKTSLVKRHRAWKRITEVYNKESPRKRTTKELNKKFSAMKAMAKKINISGYFKEIKSKRYEQLEDTIDQKIKSEPVVDCTEVYDLDSEDEQVLSNPVDMNPGTNSNRLSFTHDPLSNAIGSDSGLGSISENKEVERLKTELLQYQMETARLHRKQIEDSMKADAKEREMRALEHSLRLRAARLQVIAAEEKIPRSHPALKYTVQERRAQQYLANTALDIG